MEAGCAGTLQSIIPPRSIPAWYCFATGMNPAKMGVFGFSQRLPRTYDYTFANLTFCRAPAFWQLLNQHGLKTAIVHVPGTFPPHSVNGVLVSGWPAPRNPGNLDYTYPASLSREFDRRLGRPFEFLSEQPMRTDNNAEMLAERLRILKMHGDVAYWTLSEHAWDVGVVVLSSLDRASHQFWRHFDETHPAHDSSLAKRFGDALQRVYAASDAQVGRLLELVDEDDTVIIVSDHGFGPARRTFYLNEWLKQQGYLTVRKQNDSGLLSWRTKLLGRLTAPLFWLNQRSPLFRRLAAPFKKRMLSNYLRDEYVRAEEQGLVRLNHLPVDWSRTRAYCPDESSLYLNLRGRDPEGIVTPGAEAETLLAEIMAKLQQIPDPETGVPVPVHLHRTQDIYSGPFLQEAPDLIVAMDHYTTEAMAELGSDSLFVPNDARNGTHTLEGLLIAAGPGIAPREQTNAHLLDIAPTVLHLMGVPIPEEADGSVLTHMYAEQAAVRRREIARVSVGLAEDDETSTAFTDEEQEQVEQRLRDLGYLS